MKIQWLAASAALACLAGCASAPIEPQDASRLSRTHGFVQAQFPIMGPIDTLPGLADTTVLRNPATRAEYKLRRTEAHGPNAHGLWVPAGTYELPSFKSRAGGAFDVVVVESGRITDLGAILPIHFGDDELGTAIVQHPEVAASRAQAVAALAPHLTQRDPLVWQPASPPRASHVPAPSSDKGLIGQILVAHERHMNSAPINARLKAASTNEELLRLARTAAAPGTDEVGADRDGNVYWGAAFGQVRKRSATGEWSSVDVGTLQAITAVEADGEQLVVGTDRGEILAVSRDGGSRRKLASLGAQRTILDIDRVGARWFIIAAEVKPGTVALPSPKVLWYEVHTTTNEDLSGLKLLHRHDQGFQPHIVNGQHGRGEAGVKTYFVYGFDAQPLQIDLQSLSVATPKTPALLWLHVAPDRSVISAIAPGGALTKAYLSTDQGSTWQQIDNPPYPVYDMQFESPTEGHATRWTRGGMFTSELEFMRYDAGRNTWTVDHTAPAGCMRPLRNAQRSHQFCLTRGGSVLNWVGGTWKAEFVAN
ncbi:hypothetical protein [Rhizobacter sp. LjRoot28]|uniref:hypothetical protein n=1 Tax=Rhizobacter sp. LjRoot28 TaxID=3342309 RepID=UPI003ECFFB5D